jgi:hypothetical protein
VKKEKVEDLEMTVHRVHPDHTVKKALLVYLEFPDKKVILGSKVCLEFRDRREIAVVMDHLEYLVLKAIRDHRDNPDHLDYKECLV